MRLRRVCNILMALCLLACLCTPVSAAGNAEKDVKQAIVEACTYRRDADLSTYRVPSGELDAIFNELYNSGALPWYTADEYRYTYDQNGIVNSFEPKTLYHSDLDMAAYEEQAAQILEKCVLPGMAQWQIALALHDYLIANTAYDETLEKNSAYDILVNGTAVCAGYSLAYRDLLERAGIESYLVTSNAMEHAWNLVCIDGNWYHVDLTWDDPTPDTPGFVSHDYFLLTDAEIAAGENPHYGWDTDIPCTDTRFSDGFWRDVYCRICYESSEVSYLLRTKDWTSYLYRRDETTGKETLLYKEQKNYIDIGHGNYQYEHYGLSLRDGRLWFSSLNKLLSIKPDGTDLKTEYTHSGSTYIYCSHVSADAACLTLMTHDGVHSTQKLTLSPTGEHIHSFTRTVLNATCTEDGDTVSLCDCALEAHSTPTEAMGHDYAQTVQDATLFSDGFATYTCRSCGHSYTDILPKTAFLDFLADNAFILVLLGAVVLFVINQVRRVKKQGYQDY